MASSFILNSSCLQFLLGPQAENQQSLPSRIYADWGTARGGDCDWNHGEWATPPPEIVPTSGEWGGKSRIGDTRSRLRMVDFIALLSLKRCVRLTQMTQTALAQKLGWTRARLNKLIKGKRDITADAALDLARVLGTSAKLWMNLQATFELDKAMRRRKIA